MKKKLLIGVIVVIVISIIGMIWWFSPTHFLKKVKADEVTCVDVFNGNTGKGFSIEDKEDITYIVSNIQSISMKKEKISLGYMGYKFRLKFYNVQGKIVSEFILNGDDSIRKDPFFYRTETGKLCVDYLEELEEALK